MVLGLDPQVLCVLCKRHCESVSLNHKRNSAVQRGFSVQLKPNFMKNKEC